MRITGRQGLALIRAGLGVLFLVSAWDKTTKGWMTNPEPLTRTIGQNLERSEPFYRPFLEGTVLPNAGTFAQLVTLGEWVAGASLLLGFLTRVGGLVSMFLLLNYMLMKGTLLGAYLTSATYSDRLYFVGAVACVLAAAGLAWGLDAALGRVVAPLPGISWLAGVDPEEAAATVGRSAPRGRPTLRSLPGTAVRRTGRATAVPATSARRAA